MIKVTISGQEALDWFRRGGDLTEAITVGVRRILIRASDAVTQRIRNGDPLNQRSGRLAKSWSLKSGGEGKSAVRIDKPGEVQGEVTSASKYAAIHEFGGTILPKSGKYLSIPIGPQVMASGAIRASQASPRQIPGLFFIRSKSGNLLGVTSGKGKLGAAGGGKGGPVVDKLTLWFLLKERVNIPARRYVSLAVEDASKGAQDDMDLAIREHIARSANG